MKQKIVRILITLCLILMITCIVSNTVLGALDWSTVTGKIDTSSTAPTGIETTVNTIITLIRVIALGVAIIMLGVLAMKYMMAAPGDKAEIKKHAVVYVVGALVLFGVSGILGIIADLATNIK